MSTWYLVYMLSYSTSGGLTQLEYPMPSLDACLASVREAKVEVPQGGDAESTVSIFCTNGLEVKK